MISVADDAPVEDLTFLEDRVNEFNFATTGIHDARLLAILLRDDRGQIYAGLSGHTWGGVAEVRFLWVHEARRGSGIGSCLLEAAEEEARVRGCTKLVLSTHSFQAPGFYAQRGFVVAGAFSEYPRGHRSIFLEKALDGTGGDSRRSRYEIVHARPHDLEHLSGIELDAARLLAGYAPESVLTETTSHSDLEQAQQDGRLWVALADGIPVGFAHVETLEAGAAHLKEIDVRPAHGRRGLGTRLVDAVCQWAAAASRQSVTLTTFRDVSWNMAFYQRLGFREIPPSELSGALRSILDEEARRGLDPTRRVAMRRELAPAVR